MESLLLFKLCYQYTKVKKILLLLFVSTFFDVMSCIISNPHYCECTLNFFIIRWHSFER